MGFSKDFFELVWKLSGFGFRWVGGVIEDLLPGLTGMLANLMTGLLGLLLHLLRRFPLAAPALDEALALRPLLETL